MDRLAITEKLTHLVGKYKFVLIVLIVGVLLMLLPGKSESDKSVKTQDMQVRDALDITEEMTQILRQVKGAGEVKVMLTVEVGQSTIYQYDEDTSGRRETVIITDGSRNQSGLIQQINPPRYQGAIIVCQGADNDVVRLHIIEAVARVTGLGTDKISVLKMK